MGEYDIFRLHMYIQYHIARASNGFNLLHLNPDLDPEGVPQHGQDSRRRPT